MRRDEIATKGDIKALAEQIGAIEALLKKNAGQPEYLTIQDYAKLFNLSKSTVERHIRQGRLKAEKIGRRVRILHTHH